MAKVEGIPVPGFIAERKRFWDLALERKRVESIQVGDNKVIAIGHRYIKQPHIAVEVWESLRDGDLTQTEMYVVKRFGLQSVKAAFHGHYYQLGVMVKDDDSEASITGFRIASGLWREEAEKLGVTESEVEKVGQVLVDQFELKIEGKFDPARFVLNSLRSRARH